MLPLHPSPPFTTYIHGSWNVAKQYEIKLCASGNVLGKTLGSRGIFWEPDGNPLET
jgi:hypothetical protein